MLLCFQNLLLGRGSGGGAREDAETALSSGMRQHRDRPGRPDERPERLSRFLALVLRHKPESVGITLDPSGFTEIEDLAKAIAEQPGWTGITEAAIRAVADQDTRRYEISGTRIRARYGHSIPVETPGTPIVPPEWLFHGTAPDALDAISRDGLTPQGRQFVHLSVTRQDALAVGKRHNPDAVVVTVLARQAAGAGVLFYNASLAIYLTKSIPPEFLSIPSRQSV